MNYIETERRHFILLYQGDTIFIEWIVPSNAYLVAYTVDRIYMNKVISHDYYQDDITSLIEDNFVKWLSLDQNRETLFPFSALWQQ